MEGQKDFFNQYVVFSFFLIIFSLARKWEKYLKDLILVLLNQLN